MEFERLAADFYGYSDLLTARERESLAYLRNRLERDVAPGLDALWERAEFPPELPGILAEAGVLSDAWPELRRFENSAVYRGFVALELGRIDASVATFVGVQNGLAMGAIAQCGSAEQRAEWLPKLATAEIIGAFGLTEPLSGSDAARGLRTRARREGESWVVTGQKRWIGNATFADLVVIWAVDDHDGQVKGFLVPTASEGFSAEKIDGKISLRIVQNAQITLDQVRVPERMRLAGAHSFADTAAVLRMTRAEVAWAAVGVSIGAYEAALAYAREREQFGRKIAQSQLVQDLLVKCLGNIVASMGMVVRCSQLLDQGRQADEHSALAKSYATSRMRETVAWAREAMGGNGIVLEHGAARYFADAEALYSYEGTREMNTLIVGRAITGFAAFV